MLCRILSSIAWSIGRIEIGGKMRKVHFTYWPKCITGIDFIDPIDGLFEFEPNRSYSNHIPTWYSNRIVLPLKFRLIPIKRQKLIFAKEGGLK